MRAVSKPPVICLMGPTAAGKTELAVELVRRLPCDIVSVDSAMVYRGMDIGTAKPGPEVLAVAPHRLIDVCDPSVTYSAARFRDDARREVDSIHAVGRIPLLVGGTGLYFRAFADGLADLPAASHTLRQRLQQQAREQGWEALHARLAEVDPASAERIHPNDPQRLQRALEVYEISGRPLSELWADADAEPLPYTLIKRVVAPSDRAVLRERAKKRFYAMIEAGLVAEVTALYQRGDLDQTMASMRMVGYRQIWRYLEGQLDYQEMMTHAIVATRQLAKRQLTWFRAEQDARWYDSTDRGLLDRILTDLLPTLRTWQDCNIL